MSGTAPRSMTLEESLRAFYERHGFGDAIGSRSLTVPVYTALRAVEFAAYCAAAMAIHALIAIPVVTRFVTDVSLG